MRKYSYILVIFFQLVFCDKINCQDSIYACDGSANLYTINLLNCTTRLIGNTGKIFNDIAFTSDGRLWGINGGLYQIDKVTANITYIGSNISVGGLGLTGLNDTTLIAESNDSLYTINVKNVSYNNLGGLNGYYADGDLSWFNNKLYMTAFSNFADGFVIQISLNDTYTSVINAVPINNLNSLTPLLLGLVTIKIDGHDSLIGFNNNAYLISHIDGSYSIQCSNIISGGIAGAASMSFPSILPITLLNFSYQMDGNSVQLIWQTSSENNSNYFLIERSTDGINFSAIGKVEAGVKSNSLKQYSFTDNHHYSENFYRLKEIDKDGKYTYSKILPVLNSSNNILTVINNPANSQLKINIQNRDFRTNLLAFYDNSGKNVKSIQVQNGFQTIDVTSLSAGVYFLKMIMNDGKIIVQKFIKER